MKLLFSAILVIFLFSSFKPTNDLKRFFDDYNVIGSIVIFDKNNSKFIYYDSLRCSNQYTPASTFKIFNSLAALEAGVIKDTTHVIPWDSITRAYQSWNNDQNLKSAFKHSTVWFYQELARRIGEKKMFKYIRKNHYGNQNINGGIDLFWLKGDLRISQMEQIEFLKKLYEKKLKFKTKNQEIVKDIMLMEIKSNYRLYAKTGWSIENENGISYGLYVGFIETPNNTFFFATNIETTTPDKKFLAARKEITMKVLTELEIVE